MRKLLTVLLFFLCLFLCACDREQVSESITDPKNVTVETEAATEASTEAPTQETAPETAADTLDGYEFIYKDDRDRAWEEDIIYLAQTVLGKHPKVFENQNWIYNSKDWTTTYVAVNPYYDVELRNDFIAQIRGLLARIPDISDVSLQYELRKIVALLDDAHSNIYWVKGDKFPVELTVLYENGEAGIYIVKAPEEYGKLLYSRLVSVNGVPVKDIVYRLMQYIPSENDHLSAVDVIDQRSGSILMFVDALCAVGVLEEGKRTAEITVLDSDGETVTVTMEAVTYEEYQDMDTVSGIFTAEQYLNCEQDAESYFWYTRLEEENTYYLRISQFRDKEGYPFVTFFNDIMLQLYEVEEPQKVIIDLRGNGGGKALWGYVNNFFGRLDGANTDGVYILLDELSCSASVIMSCQIKDAVDDAVIVDTPAGQPPNFFMGQTYDTLPHSGLGFQIASIFEITWKNYAYDALMPDVTVYQTLEDYRNGIDTVLKAVLEMDEAS